MGNKRVDPFYGKNVWPDEALKRKFTAVNEAMYEATLRVLRGCDPQREETLKVRLGSAR